MASDSVAVPGQAVEAERIFKVPDPYPLTLAGLVAAMGPQAINFGISIGGGETQIIPRVAALGGMQLYWIMTLSTILETVVVIECVKHALVTGRSFFAATRDIPPKGMFWPVFWAVVSPLTWGWPSWLSGASAGVAKLTGIGTPYMWAAVGLILCLFVFWLSPHVYGSISKLFIAIMWINIVTVLTIVVLVATPTDYLTVLQGYFSNPFNGMPPPLPADHPTAPGQKVSFVEVGSLFNQPGGSLMWVSLWALEAGWGMGRYYGKVTGVLRPPERINVHTIKWDYNDPSEVKKMKGWVAIGDWSQIIWWSILGAMLMTFLYGTAGHVYLYKLGIVKSGFDVPLQMAYVAQAAFGPIMMGVMLVFIVVTLYDAEFAYYDTFFGRTATEAIALKPGLVTQARPYRWWYLMVVTICILAGFGLVAINQPYALWLFTAFMANIWRAVGAFQIWYLNRSLPKEFRPGPIRVFLLWFTIVISIPFIGIWLYGNLTGQ
jgi:hypothetical protein